MKSILALLVVVLLAAPLLRAMPVTPVTIAIASPKVGQAPNVYHYLAGTTPYYMMSWRTVMVGTTTTNYLVSFTPTPITSQAFTADNNYAATTYAEMTAKATALGIRNLSADPNAGH